MRFFLIYAILFFTMQQLHAQVYGCTDPQAVNFNANATINNGGCTYPDKLYAPVLRATLPAALKEISGMIYFKGKLLALNDGGAGNMLYMLDTTNGSILQTITLEHAVNIDWEDIAQDSINVYVADVGNNLNGNRTDLCIYKIAREAFDQPGDFTIPASAIQKIRFSYPDQLDFKATGPNNTPFDCEAVLVRNNKLHLFSKNWTGNFTVHYSIPVDAGTYIATRLDSLDTGNLLITGADIGADDEMLLTGYDLLGACSFYLIYGFDSSQYFFNTGNKRSIRLPSLFTSGQLESVCFVNATHGFIANEYLRQSIFNVSNKLRTFSTSQFIIDYYKHHPKQSDATAGMLRYNATTDQFEIFTGLIWEGLNDHD